MARSISRPHRLSALSLARVPRGTRGMCSEGPPDYNWWVFLRLVHAPGYMLTYMITCMLTLLGDLQHQFQSFHVSLPGPLGSGMIHAAWIVVNLYRKSLTYNPGRARPSPPHRTPNFSKVPPQLAQLKRKTKPLFQSPCHNPCQRDAKTNAKEMLKPMPKRC
jgi:hypothetical protein